MGCNSRSLHGCYLSNVNVCIEWRIYICQMLLPVCRATVECSYVATTAVYNHRHLEILEVFGASPNAFGQSIGLLNTTIGCLVLCSLLCDTRAMHLSAHSLRSGVTMSRHEIISTLVHTQGESLHSSSQSYHVHSMCSPQTCE